MDEIMYEVKEITKNPELSFVTNEIDYWKRHKYYMRKIKKLKRNYREYIYYPDKYIRDFEEVVNNMYSEGVISLENANEIREKLFNDLNYNNKFKTWVAKKLRILKRKDKKLMK